MASRIRDLKNTVKLDRSVFLRWLVLLGLGAWLLHPLATSHIYGTGDAVWYASMLADFVEQLRAGVFPVFVGQTQFAFNGAIYPLRVAPLFQHIGGALDFITFHRLGNFALLHTELIVIGFAGLISCYLCAAAVLQKHKWIAVAMAGLYLSCPGILALVYVQDLYMSWTAIPFVPLVFYGALRSFDDDGLVAWGCIVVGLAGLWLAHAPIAFWASAIVGIVELTRLLRRPTDKRAWRRGLLAGGAFAVLAEYPFVSVASLHGAGSHNLETGVLAQPERIVAALRDAFPGCLLPLSQGAASIADLQLGYGLWLVVALGAGAFVISKNPRIAWLLGCIVFILLIVLPIPGWSELFWLRLTPEVVRRLTFYWPMHRLYILLAGMSALLGAVGAAEIVRRNARAARYLTVLFATGLLWSFWESRQFVKAAELRTANAESSTVRQHDENLLLMNHAYGLFAALPSHYSNGVMDPESEQRLIDDDGHAAPQDSNESMVQQGTFTAAVDPNPGILNLKPSLKLRPGLRYDLRFEFPTNDYQGILQLVGRSVFREYALPESGQPLAFGTKPNNGHTISLWTTAQSPDAVTLRYIPTGGNRPALGDAFAHFMLVERSADRTVKLITLVPLELEIRTKRPAHLETSRMYVPGYTATVNGVATPVISSKDGLAEVAIPQGRSDVKLIYVAPFKLRFAYWAELVAWAALVVAAAVHGCRSIAKEPVGHDGRPTGELSA